jgi:hypothetical protein
VGWTCRWKDQEWYWSGSPSKESPDWRSEPSHPPGTDGDRLRSTGPRQWAGIQGGESRGRRNSSGHRQIGNQRRTNITCFCGFAPAILPGQSHAQA